MSRTGAGRKPFGPADALLLALILVWGVNYTVIKVAFTRLSPLVFNAARFVLATATVLGILSASGANLRLPARLRRQSALLGILSNSVYQLFFIEGLARTSVAHAALIQASMPSQVALLAHLSGRERLSRRGWAGIALTAAGLALLLSLRPQRGAASATLMGDLLMFGASLTWACYTLLATRVLAQAPASSVTAIGFLAGTPLLLLFALPQLPRQDWQGLGWAGWGGVVFSGVLAIGLGYFAWNLALRALGSTRTAVYSNLTPVVAALLAWLALGETWSFWQLVGALLALAGVMLTRFAPAAGREQGQREVLADRRACPPLGSTQAGRFSGGKRPGIF